MTPTTLTLVALYVAVIAFACWACFAVVWHPKDTSIDFEDGE